LYKKIKKSGIFNPVKSPKSCFSAIFGHFLAWTGNRITRFLFRYFSKYIIFWFFPAFSEVQPLMPSSI